MIGKLVLGAALVATAIGVAPGPADAGKPPCRGRSVYVWRNDPLPCDVSPPQRLHVVGRIGQARCDDIGGRYGWGICWDIDY